MTDVVATAGGTAGPFSGPWRGVNRLFRRRRQLAIVSLLGPAVAWMVLIYIASLVLMVVSAFYKIDGFTSRPTNETTIDNVERAFTTYSFFWVVVRSALIAAAVTLVCLAIAVPVAFFIAKVARPWARRGLIVAVLMPLWAGYLVKGYAWKAMPYRRFEHGPGAFKVDFAVEEGVPWTAPAARQAGTVHLGGGLAEIVANEQAVHRGAMPARPFTLVGQQYLADPTRSVGNIHPVWSYAHVPHGYTGDATAAIIDQIERFAPSFRERIVGMAVRSTTEMSIDNTNYVGGDVIGGASTPTQLLFRPRFAIDPYFTGVAGTYLCSASTPPGAGAHGMCGANAAARALAALGTR